MGGWDRSINNTKIGQRQPKAGAFTTLQGKYQSVSIKTESYTITSADFGKSLRMNSAADKIFTSPSVGAADDGAKLRLIKLGAGKVTFQCVDTDTVGDSGATGSVYNGEATETYAFIDLEYVHATTNWLMTGFGTWTTTT